MRRQGGFEFAPANVTRQEVCEFASSARATTTSRLAVLLVLLQQAYASFNFSEVVWKSFDEVPKKHIPILSVAYAVPMNEWKFDVARLTRLYNPFNAMYLMTPLRDIDPRHYFHLASLRISVRQIWHYNAPGTGTHELEQVSRTGFDGKRWDHHSLRNTQRWCLGATVAEVEGHDRILVMDQDVILLTNIDSLLERFNADIVSVRDYTSQFVYASKYGLQQLCQFSIDMFKGKHGKLEDHLKHFNQEWSLHDMHIMELFTELRPDMTVELFCPSFKLTGKGTDCLQSEQWSTAIESLQWMWGLGHKEWNKNCHMNEDHLMLLKQEMPALPTAYWKAEGRDIHLPVLHFQGSCQAKISQFARKLDSYVPAVFNVTLIRELLYPAVV